MSLVTFIIMLFRPIFFFLSIFLPPCPYHAPFTSLVMDNMENAPINVLSDSGGGNYSPSSGVDHTDLLEFFMATIWRLIVLSTTQMCSTIVPSLIWTL